MNNNVVAIPNLPLSIDLSYVEDWEEVKSSVVTEHISKEHEDSAMIAFDCNVESVIKLRDSLDGDRVDDLHITLLYLGEISKLYYDEICDTLNGFTRIHAPIVGKYSGVATFEPNAEGKYPIVITFDSVGLPEFRQILRNSFPDIKQDHGFVPHTTLAYNSRIPTMDVPDIAMELDTLYLYWGQNKIAFPLTGDLVYKGGPGSGFHGHEGRPGKVGGSLPKSRVVIAYHRTSQSSAKRILDEGFDIRYFGKGGGLGLMEEPAGIFVSPEGYEDNFRAEVAERGLPYSAVLKLEIPDSKVWRPSKQEIIDEFNIVRREFFKNKYSIDNEELLDAFVNGNWRKIKAIVGDEHGEYEYVWKPRLFDYMSTKGELELKFAFSDNIRKMGYSAVEWEEPLYHVRQMVVIDPSSINVIGDVSDLYPIYKGGPGSGHHGHAGRPGKQGGSVPNSEFDLAAVDYVSQLNPIRGRRTSYWIMPNDKIVEISSPAFTTHRMTEHRDIVAIYPEKFGLDIDAIDMDELYGFKLTEYALEMNPTLVRVARYSAMKPDGGGEANIHVHTLNDSSLARLQKLYDDNKLFIKYGDDVVLDSSIGSVKVSLSEFLDAKHVIVGKTGIVLKSDDTVEKQLPIDDKSKQRILSIRQGIFDTDVSTLAERMYTGEVSIGQWEETMKKLIREFHSSAAAIQKGGWDQMTWADWGRLGNPLKEQYKYLHKFAEKIAATRDTISLPAIQARAKMYGNAASHTANLVMAGDVLSKHLPWLPRDGSTECLVNCKCRWELEVVDEFGDWKTVQAVWKLSPAEHCDDCIDRNGFTVSFNVFKTVQVPAIIGYNG